MRRSCPLGAGVFGPQVKLVEPGCELVELAGLFRNGLHLLCQPLLDVREPKLGLGLETGGVLFAISRVSQDLLGAIARTSETSRGVRSGNLRRLVSLERGFGA